MLFDVWYCVTYGRPTEIGDKFFVITYGLMTLPLLALCALGVLVLAAPMWRRHRDIRLRFLVWASLVIAGSVTWPTIGLNLPNGLYNDLVSVVCLSVSFVCAIVWFTTADRPRRAEA